MTTPPSETGEQEGLWSLRLAQILCAPTFAFPFLYLLLWVAHRLPSKARDGIGLLFIPIERARANPGGCWPGSVSGRR